MNQNIKNQTKTCIPKYRFFAKTGVYPNNKSCPMCGQDKIPFKKGVCPNCSSQVSDIQYVRDPKEYVRSNYGNVKTGIKEVYQRFR